MKHTKYRINYKKLSLSIIVLIVIIAFAILGIKSISKIGMTADIKDINGSNPEVVIPEDITINMVAIGDVMCHSTNFKAAYNSTTKEYDFSPVFTNVAKYITKADISIRKLRNNICRRIKRILRISNI